MIFIPVLLRAGKIVRFRGATAEADSAEFAREMHGRCTLVATHEFMITKSTHYGPKLAAGFTAPATSFADFTGNGRHDAKPHGRTLGAVLGLLALITPLLLTGCGSSSAQTRNAAPKSIELAWDASPEATEYQLYEVIAPGNYIGEDAPIAAPATTHTLSNVAPGHHVYVVTALNAAGEESVYSNEAVADVPAPPNAPANLRATVKR